MIKPILNIIVLVLKMIFVVILTILLLIIHFIVCFICNPIISFINFVLDKEVPYVDICKLFERRR